jgi:hypothetical protein
MLDVRDHAGPCWTICGTLTRAIELRTIQPKNKKVGDFESARPHYRFFLSIYRCLLIFVDPANNEMISTDIAMPSPHSSPSTWGVQVL